MCGSIVDIQSAATENRQGEKRRKKETTAALFGGHNDCIFI